jgi:hypothetical protein
VPALGKYEFMQSSSLVVMTFAADGRGRGRRPDHRVPGRRMAPRAGNRDHVRGDRAIYV